MVQWKNLNRNDSLLRLPFLCEISGALLLAQPGLTAGWQADEIHVYLEIVDQNIVAFNEDSIVTVVPMYSRWLMLVDCKR